MICYDITCSVMIWYHLSHFCWYRFLDRTLKEFDWRHIFFWIHLKYIQIMLNLIISDHLISNVPYLAICKIYLFSSLLFFSIFVWEFVTYLILQIMSSIILTPASLWNDDLKRFSAEKAEGFSLGAKVGEYRVLFTFLCLYLLFPTCPFSFYISSPALPSAWP